MRLMWMAIGIGVGAATLTLGPLLSLGIQQAQATSRPLADDVHPDSLSRLPLVKRDDLSGEARKAFDAFASNTQGLAGLSGPRGLRLHSPRLATSRGSASRYLRYESDLGRRLSELAILVTAREMDQQFEWTLHEPEARRVGLEQGIIDVVKHRQDLTGLGEKEATIIQLGREIFRTHRVRSDTFDRALQLFGPRTLVDLASLIGEYASTGILLTTFDQQIPLDREPLLPLP